VIPSISFYLTLSQKDAVQTSTQLTSSLKAAVDMMTAEVEKSRAASSLLQESTTTLSSTSSMYSTYQGVLKQSSKIVGRMRRKEWLDRWLIYLALAFFCFVASRIVWRRIWIPFYDRRAVSVPVETYVDSDYHDEF
jgi:protein transport protein SEC20